MSEPNGLRVLVVTGLSGSGISTAIHALEDAGFFCVDNLPPPLLIKLVELARDSYQAQRNNLVVGLDARGVEDARATVALLEEIRRSGTRVDIFYLEASDPVLLRRFSESRRRHPMVRRGRPLPEAVQEERLRMAPFREVATTLIDTSKMNVHQCKRRVQAAASETEGQPNLRMAVAVASFGFRHGVPPESDVVWDVRFLPNPHFVDDLRPRTGLDPAVATYVLERPETQMFLDRFLGLLEEVLPHYEHEGKSNLTVAIGCTGGRHRSVAIAERVAEHLRGLGREPTVRHRDIDKKAK